MSIEIKYEIPFHDVDSLRIVWHGHYYKYFELARTALYRSHNLDVDRLGCLGYIFPVIESHCRYAVPLVYGQKIRITALFKHWDHYLRIEYSILDEASNNSVASGYTKQAVCDEAGQLLMRVPEDVVNAISA